MGYLQWDERYSVNVREIDDQHRTLVEMINSLFRAIAEERGKDAQKDVIEKIVGYAWVHFETEEKYMTRIGYPGFAAHREEHDAFREKALELKERADRGGFILTLEILKFLKEWLLDHVPRADGGYAEHSRKRGEREAALRR